MVEILSTDANYSSRVINANQTVLSEVHLDYLRSAPVYHFIEAADQISLYSLEITPLQLTRLASATINLYALPSGSKPDAELASAWRKLGRGLQVVIGESAEDWAENLVALNAAQKLFERFDLHEPSLWAQYFNAYFEYYPLYRYSESLAAASELIETSSKLDLPLLTMLSHQLAGQIRIEREAVNDELQARLNYQQAQDHFNAARQIAQDLNYGFETIWAINNSGITFNYQDQMGLSLQRYAEAKSLAIEMGDPFLTSLIGTNMAVAQQRLGHIDEAIETLLRLQQELTVQRDPVEMEHVLSLIGMYYVRLYQFPQALEALNTALELSITNGRAESRGRNRLYLGKAYREMGQPEKSLAHLELAISHFETARDGRGLKLSLALRADIYRLQQRFDGMASDRTRQKQYLATDSDQAEWLASKASDAAAELNYERAIDLFRQSAKMYATTSFSQLGYLAELRACGLESRAQTVATCSTENFQTEYQQIQSLQASIPAIEGKYLWAKLLAAEGKLLEAGSVMTHLVDEILFYRKSLPGVLGAWYLDARKEIFDFHMQLLLDSGADKDVIAFDTLLALSKLHNTDLGRTIDTSILVYDRSKIESAHELRVMLARRDQAKTKEFIEAAQRNIDQLLLTQNGRNVVKATNTYVEALRQQLHNLPDDWSVLAYHFINQQVYAWVGNKQGLKMHKMGTVEKIQGLIESTNTGIRTFNHHSSNEEMTTLGDLLITPIQHELRFNVLFIGAGALSDFPLEALLVDEDPLIRNHRVVNIMSAIGLDQVVVHLVRPYTPRQLFLAGSPKIQSQNLQPLAGATRELASIQQRFENKNITLVQGVNLTRQALDTEAFNSADLIHIASHATIDREYPELSRIMLASSEENSIEYITPAELDHRQISAQLVVLSACSTVGLNRFEYDSDLGFVSKFLQLGSNHVIASLWTISDQQTATFLVEFYKNLASGQDVASALRDTKLKLIDAGQASINQWAAFQLFSQ